MLFVVLLTDQPDHAQVRADHLQAHIDWLERHKDVIQVGGSLRREPSETPKGGLWIAQADSKQIIDELLQTDPFYLAGLLAGPRRWTVGEIEAVAPRLNCSQGR